jgi:hypothetical protein
LIHLHIHKLFPLMKLRSMPCLHYQYCLDINHDIGNFFQYSGTATRLKAKNLWHKYSLRGPLTALAC